MPRGNRTGPWGQGPRTGRGLGFCSGETSPGYTQGSGMGLGRGYGRRRGWGRGRRGFPGRGFAFSEPPLSNIPFLPQISQDDEVRYLEATLKGLKNEIDNIEKRLDDISKKEKNPI